MDLSGKEGVGTGAQLLPKKMCERSPGFKANTGALQHIGFDP